MTALCRRTLLKGAAATCGAGLLAACGGAGSGTSSGAAPEAAVPPASGAGAPPGGGGVRVTLAQVSEIPVGGAVSVEAPDGTTVLLAQPEAGKVVGLRATCPHEGCSAAPDGDHFSCPCHGSQFALDGSLQQGPAREGLSSYDVRVVDGQVLPA